MFFTSAHAQTLANAGILIELDVATGRPDSTQCIIFDKLHIVNIKLTGSISNL